MNNIFLSIIIPVYNTEKYVADCLESVIQVVDVPYEIICVNDGSSDGSLSILEEYAKRYEYIRVITQVNAGLSVARNTGVLNVKGKYIIFLDSDDMLTKGALNELCNRLQADSPQVLVYDAECIYENEYLRKTQFKDEYYRRKKAYGSNRVGQELFCEMIEANDYCDSACLLAIEREWLLETGLLFKKDMIYEDCLFTFWCYMLAKKISHINKGLMVYRIREKSIMQSRPTFKYVDSRLEIYCEILKYLMEHECSDRLQNAIEKFAEFISSNLNLKYAELQVDEKEKYHTLSGEKGIIFKNLCNTSLLCDSETQVYIKGFEGMIRDCDNLFIYGAGKVGTLVYEYLKKTGMQQKVKGYIVSDIKTVSKKTDIDIFEISEVKDKNALILLCARKDYQEEMFIEAKKNAFENIIPINHRLENYITSI